MHAQVSERKRKEEQGSDRRPSRPTWRAVQSVGAALGESQQHAVHDERTVTCRWTARSRETIPVRTAVPLTLCVSPSKFLLYPLYSYCRIGFHEKVFSSVRDWKSPFDPAVQSSPRPELACLSREGKREGLHTFYRHRFKEEDDPLTAVSLQRPYPRSRSISLSLSQFIYLSIYLYPSRSPSGHSFSQYTDQDGPHFSLS